MSKILYINQKQLTDSRMPELSDYLPNYQWDDFHNAMKYNKHAHGLYWRSGVNNLPFKNDFINHFNLQIPEYDPNFNLDFASITDQYVHTLLKTRQDKPWLILYSGGIDSTVIVTALLKNLSKEDLSNIVIACNQISVIENPKFYYNHIKTNFKIIDSTNLKLSDAVFEKYYVFNGEPADQIYGSGMRLMLQDGGEMLLKDWRKDPDDLLTLLTPAIGRDGAKWYYELIKANIESVDVPVVNYYDFFWWISFNLAWAGIILRPIHLFQTKNIVSSIDGFFNNFISWYNTPEYQQWGMNNHLDTKYALNIGQRKLASKKYIYDFDHDEYYFHFKLKMASLGRFVDTANNWFCLTDDYTRLFLDTDLDKILELLPEHINRQY